MLQLLIFTHGGLHMRTTFSLDKIINLNKWQTIQDSISQLSHLAILTTDFKGQALTKHSNCSNFCNYVRNVPSLAKQCQKCDARGGLEAVRINKPYIYRCHFDIIDIAIPIEVNNKYIGAILAGQVRLLYPEKGNHLEQIVSASPSYFEIIQSSPKLSEYYDALPRLDCDHIYSTALTLYQISKYIVEESLSQDLITNTNPSTLSLHNDVSDLSDHDINIAKDRLSSLALNKHFTDNSNNTESITNNSVIAPAISYIYNNKQEFLSLKDASILCHVSSSYFSRLFYKEVGENYSTFLSNLKVTWSKQLLENTDWPISKISEELGFNEPAYFIKTFKKYERITPAVYRKYLKH